MRDEIARLESALRYVDSNDRDVWVRAAMSVKAALGEAGFPIWNAWSRTSQKYNERSAHSVWRSVKAEGGITAGYIFGLAKESGWTSDDSAPARVDGRTQEHARAQVREQEAKVQRAAQLAATIIAQATRDMHPYLERKGFPKRLGLVYRDLLVVPLRTPTDNALVSVQLIDDQGVKKFLKHGRASRGVHKIGGRKTGRNWYCEGYATGLSIKTALDAMSRRNDGVVVTFSDSGIVRHSRGDVRALIVADNDASEAGEIAAKKTGRPYWMPPVIGTDANDFHRAVGLTATTTALRRLLVSD